MIEVRETVDLVLPDDLTEAEKECFNQDLNFMFDFADKVGGETLRTIFPHAILSLLSSKNKTVSTIYSNPKDFDNRDFVPYVTKLAQEALNAQGIYIFNPFSVNTVFLRSRDEIIGQLTKDYFEGGENLVFEILKEYKPKILKALTHFEAEEEYTGNNGEINRMFTTIHGIQVNTVNRVKRSLGVKPELFWPSFNQTPKELFDNFIKSDATVLILYGDPGLGKTQYIHELLDCMKKGKIYSTDNKEVFNHPNFIEKLVGLKENDIFITEDGMEMLRKREDGNSTMVGVLNATQGLNSSGSKFIISTNYTDLRDIDPALIRPGRTYRAIEFKKLTVEQANELRAAYERPVVDFGDKKSLTLAEALNWEDFIETESQRRSFGFNN